MKVTKETAKAFIAGDKKAIEEVYTAYHDLLYFVIFSYTKTKEDADDAYEETFLRLLNNKDAIKEPKALQSYLLLTAKSVAIDIAKKNSKMEYLFSIEEEASPSSEPLDSLLPYTLSKEDKEIIGLRLVFSFSWNEISAILSKPISTLKKQYREALNEIKEELK